MFNLIVSIHQPNYLPWPGFFHKIAQSDIYVVFDDVQLPRGKKNNFVVRNRIKTEGGAKWLTIPVKDKSSMLPINKIEINNQLDWNVRHWNSIKHNYAKATFFSEYKEQFQKILEKDWKMIVDLNVTIVQLLMKILGIDTKIVWSSKLGINKSGTEKILGIIEALGADQYLSGSGPGSTKYVYDKEELFKERGIQIKYQKFEQPIYQQLFGDFIPHLSICDMLFNIGPEKTALALNVS